MRQATGSSLKHVFIGAVLLFCATRAGAPASADPYPIDPIADSWQTTCDILGKKLDGTSPHDADTFVRVAEGIQHRYVLSYDAAVLVMQQQVQQHCGWRP